MDQRGRLVGRHVREGPRLGLAELGEIAEHGDRRDGVLPPRRVPLQRRQTRDVDPVNRSATRPTTHSFHLKDGQNPLGNLTLDSSAISTA